ncbi:MAG: class I SAM-dependent methyltransferase [Xanthomonadales bacterium]|nr:class I SAM-dependent methyltransferase [Xanthomonadales bacterium]
MLIDLCERGLIPDSLTRLGIRRLCAQRLRDEHAGDAEAAWVRFRSLLGELRQSPVAIETDAANEQHYEVPARFFELCLGKRYKYSSCYYPTGRENLDAAEEAMLALYGERAELEDGQHILELGCGWGSLTLWMAERFPGARITGVSNSNSQREHIMARAAERGLGNVEIITCDVNRLQLERSFDRVVSIEMFEHMRNYATLLERVSGWLKPGGKLFVHIFCHRELMYPFETEGDDNWMGRYFFTGGLMPAADTLLHFQSHLALEQQWRLNGRHYEQTANHWLQNQDRHRDEVMKVLMEAYGAAEASRWFQRWRMFWMACAELFGYRDGNEWLVAHYRFVKR